MWVKLLPAAAACVTAIGGWFYALWLRRNRPQVYADLAETDLRGTGRAHRQPASTTADRYCIVGGGPAGLVMARAFLAEGVPFDLFERHDAVGGIWDQDNPGSPMYDSAHFISSKYTSSFYGYPMPADYPDYPRHDQILDYIRGFAVDVRPRRARDARRRRRARRAGRGRLGGRARRRVSAAATRASSAPTASPGTRTSPRSPASSASPARCGTR